MEGSSQGIGDWMVTKLQLVANRIKPDRIHSLEWLLWHPISKLVLLIYWVSFSYSHAAPSDPYDRFQNIPPDLNAKLEHIIGSNGETFYRMSPGVQARLEFSHHTIDPFTFLDIPIEASRDKIEEKIVKFERRLEESKSVYEEAKRTGKYTSIVDPKKFHKNMEWAFKVQKAKIELIKLVFEGFIHQSSDNFAKFLRGNYVWGVGGEVPPLGVQDFYTRCYEILGVNIARANVVLTQTPGNLTVVTSKVIPLERVFHPTAVAHAIQFYMGAAGASLVSAIHGGNAALFQMYMESLLNLETHKQYALFSVGAAYGTQVSGWGIGGLLSVLGKDYKGFWPGLASMIGLSIGSISSDIYFGLLPELDALELFPPEVRKMMRNRIYEKYIVDTLFESVPSLASSVLMVKGLEWLGKAGLKKAGFVSTSAPTTATLTQTFPNVPVARPNSLTAWLKRVGFGDQAVRIYHDNVKKGITKFFFRLPGALRMSGGVGGTILMLSSIPGFEGIYRNNVKLPFQGAMVEWTKNDFDKLIESYLAWPLDSDFQAIEEKRENERVKQGGLCWEPFSDPETQKESNIPSLNCGVSHSREITMADIEYEKFVLQDRYKQSMIAARSEHFEYETQNEAQRGKIRAEYEQAINWYEFLGKAGAHPISAMFINNVNGWHAEYGSDQFTNQLARWVMRFFFGSAENVPAFGGKFVPAIFHDTAKFNFPQEARVPAVVNGTAILESARKGIRFVPISTNTSLTKSKIDSLEPLFINAMDPFNPPPSVEAFIRKNAFQLKIDCPLPLSQKPEDEFAYLLCLLKKGYFGIETDLAIRELSDDKFFKLKLIEEAQSESTKDIINRVYADPSSGHHILRLYNNWVQEGCDRERLVENGGCRDKSKIFELARDYVEYTSHRFNVKLEQLQKLKDSKAWSKEPYLGLVPILADIGILRTCIGVLLNNKTDGIYTVKSCLERSVADLIKKFETLQINKMADMSLIRQKFTYDDIDRYAVAFNMAEQLLKSLNEADVALVNGLVKLKKQNPKYRRFTPGTRPEAYKESDEYHLRFLHITTSLSEIFTEAVGLYAHFQEVLNILDLAKVK